MVDVGNWLLYCLRACGTMCLNWFDIPNICIDSMNPAFQPQDGYDACGSCKGCGVSTGKVVEGLTCCELSGELFCELSGLGVCDLDTM